jgi:hypothetical protein
MSLLIDIARCSNVPICLSSSNSSHRCAGIVGLQGKRLDEHQVPEPWSGRLELAPVLFLSSNPAISEEDAYPRWNWLDDEIIDYFTNRFQGGQKEWVKDGIYCLCREGTAHHQYGVRYWQAIRRRAAELLGTGNVRPGIDYVLSEVVHCKSRDERGVRTAMETCAHLYLEKLVSTAAAKVVIVVGRFAAGAARCIFSIPSDASIFGPVLIGNRLRYFAFLPHPNSFGQKTFPKSLSPEALSQLQRFLKTGQNSSTAF